MIIKVKKRDIILGRDITTDCPIARAIRRVRPNEQGFVTAYAYSYTKNGVRFHVVLPQQVSDFVMTFDEHKLINKLLHPVFSFTLEV